MGHRTVDVETASGGGTTTTHYLWCGGSICQTRDGSDNVLRRDLTEGEYNVSSGQKLVYMPDQLASARDVIDASTGNLVQSYDYTPYGAVARSNGSTPTDYQYAGLFYHQASGLNFGTYRVQDGNTGRWLNRDPIKEYGGLSLYSYGASPIMGVDPYGLLQFPFGPLDPATQQQIDRIIGTEVTTLEEGDSAGPLGILGATIAIIWGTPNASTTPQSQSQNDDNCKCRNNNHPDIYRGGNAAGPRLDNVRPQDFPEFSLPLGMVGPPGGISSAGSVKGSGAWWKFPAGSPVPEGICLVNDSGDHWLWQPVAVMPLSIYIQLLQTTGPVWTRVQ